MLARSAARRLGDSAARRPVGSPARWERPRNRSHVAARDRTTKPSRGHHLRLVGLRTPADPSAKQTRARGITAKNANSTGGAKSRRQGKRRSAWSPGKGQCSAEGISSRVCHFKVGALSGRSMLRRFVGNRSPTPAIIGKLVLLDDTAAVGMRSGHELGATQAWRPHLSKVPRSHELTAHWTADRSP